MSGPDKVTVYRQLITHFMGKGMIRIDADRAAKAVLDGVVEKIEGGKSLDGALASSPAPAEPSKPLPEPPKAEPPKPLKASPPKTPSKRKTKK